MHEGGSLRGDEAPQAPDPRRIRGGAHPEAGDLHALLLEGGHEVVLLREEVAGAIAEALTVSVAGGVHEEVLRASRSEPFDDPQDGDGRCHSV
jgi:hypothetical protein